MLLTEDQIENPGRRAGKGGVRVAFLVINPNIQLNSDAMISGWR
jgi:hypothetical protein